MQHFINSIRSDLEDLDFKDDEVMGEPLMGFEDAPIMKVNKEEKEMLCWPWC